MIKGLTNEDIKGFYNYIEKTKDFKDSHITYSNESVRLVRGAINPDEYVVYDSDFLLTLHKALTTARNEGRVVEFRGVLANDLKTKVNAYVKLELKFNAEKQVVALTNLLFQFTKSFDYVGTMHKLHVEINEKDYHTLTYGHKDRLNELYSLKLERAFAYRVRFRNNVTEGDVELLHNKEPFTYLANFAVGKNKKLLSGLTDYNYKEQLKVILPELDVARLKIVLDVATTQLEMLDKKLTERDTILDSYLHLNDRYQEEHDREQFEKINNKK